MPATIHTPASAESTNDSGLNSITPREWEVLLLLTEDTTNTEISDKLHLTPESVKTYRFRIGNFFPDLINSQSNNTENSHNNILYLPL